MVTLTAIALRNLSRSSKLLPLREAHYQLSPDKLGRILPVGTGATIRRGLVNRAAGIAAERDPLRCRILIDVVDRSSAAGRAKRGPRPSVRLELPTRR
jgi:hypothetical protein